MRASFFGLDIAVTGLYASQRALDVVNHNISNVNTPGYSRQTINQIAGEPISVKDGTGMVGTGTQVVSTTRIRDEYLDFKYWSENISYGEWNVKNSMLPQIEGIFNEPSENGFNTVLNDFFSAVQELSKDPSSIATRAVVKEKGLSVAQYFNNTATSLEKVQSDANYAVKTKVEEVNSIAEQVRALNEQIYQYELQGNTANDLRDQRTVLVDKLSKIIKVDAQEVTVGKLADGRDDKRFQVVVDGKYLVDNFRKYNITYRQNTVKTNPEDTDGIFSLEWDDGTPFDPGGGELKGYLDIRDGAGDNKNEYKGVPFYLRKLNTFVRTFAKAFNEGFIDYNGNGTIEAGEDKLGHADGYGLNSATGDPLPGIRFFTINNQSSATFINGLTLPDDINNQYNNMTAKNMSLSQDIRDDVKNIFTSPVAGQTGNGGVLLNIIDFRHDPKIFNEGTPEDYMRSLISNLGIDTQESERFLQNQQNIIKQIDNRRSSESGVSLDEEMANMVKYQHAYNASAKLISTLGELYDTLINKLGNF